MNTKELLNRLTREDSLDIIQNYVEMSILLIKKTSTVKCFVCSLMSLN